MRSFLLVIALKAFVSPLPAQNIDMLEGVWFYQPSEFYRIFLKDGQHYYLSVYPDEVVFEELHYGFYENCDPASMDDLTLEGTGEYFFMIDDHILKGDSKKIISERLDCWAITIDHDNNTTGDYESDSLYLHFSRRAILDYVKMDRLPERLEAFLNEEHPRAYREYCKILKDR